MTYLNAFQKFEQNTVKIIRYSFLKLNCCQNDRQPPNITDNKT